MKHRAIIIVVSLTLLACSRNAVDTYESPTDYLTEKSMQSISLPDPVIELSIEDTEKPVETGPKNVPDIHPREEKPLYGITFETNQIVKCCIKRYTKNESRYFKNTLYRFDTVRPTMERIFEEQGLPKDLVYLSLIESGGNPYAVSYAGATGYWQFMTATARRYGLKVNKWVDERRDLEKSTLAAACYLKHLHSLFDDWLLAGAAYNAGEGTIRRILKRHPDVESFWDITWKMPIKRETLAYIPKFLATLVLAKNRQHYGLDAYDKSNQYPLYETITVNTFTYLDEISEITGVPAERISYLNPELTRGCSPPASKSYRLKVPKGSSELVSSYLSSMHDQKITYVTHTVKRGDTLSHLAQDHSTSISRIAKTNRITSKDILSLGQELIIPTNTNLIRARSRHSHVVSRGETVKSISRTYGVTVQDIIEVNRIKNPGLIYPDMILKIPPKKRISKRTRTTQYNVKKGDTIWGISRLFEVSTEDVKRWNKISSNEIFPGDRLTIYHR